MRHADVVEKHVSIVHGRIAVFWSYIAHYDARKGLVRLHVANLNDERMRSVIDQLV